MNAKLGRALACAMLSGAMAAAWIWLPGASAEQYGRDSQRQFVSDVFGGATRTVVTGQCIRTTMPDAGSAPAGCVEAPAETAKATPAPQPPPAAAEPPAAAAAPAAPAAQAEPSPQPASEPVAEAIAEEQASTDSTYTEEIADTQAAFAPEPEPAAEAPAAEEIAETQAATEPQPDAAAEASPEPAREPPAEVVEAPAPAAPEPPAQEAIPAPTPPAPPQPRKLRLAADTRFHFDRAELTPAGTADLDALVGELAGMQVVAVTIVGYTDRIGPDDYNRKLSQRRADTVKAYLESHRLEAQRVEAIGRGKNDPVTTPQECKGLRGQRLIKCLAPDRRVEIEIVGLSTPAQ